MRLSESRGKNLHVKKQLTHFVVFIFSLSLTVAPAFLPVLDRVLVYRNLIYQSQVRGKIALSHSIFKEYKFYRIPYFKNRLYRIPKSALSDSRFQELVLPHSKKCFIGFQNCILSCLIGFCLIAFSHLEKNCQEVVKKLSKSCQKLSKSCHKVVKICKTFVKIGDNCISIKSRWEWRGGSKSDSTAFGRLP
jgi:hypothetical protein